MKANDYMNQENNRAYALNKLSEVCDQLGLSWNATEHVFAITLPVVEEAPVTPIVTHVENQRMLSTSTRKSFDISKWGEQGISESNDIVDLPDDMQLPDSGEILEEGVPPQGDPQEEK